MAATNPIYQENIVKPDEFLRAAALNDLYTLRKFYDYECRYSWGTTPKEMKEDPAKKKKKTKDVDETHGDVRSEKNMGTSAAEHRVVPQNYRTPEGESALHLACAYGNFRAMKYIFDQGGYNINDTDIEGFNCVHHAVLGGNLDCFKWVISKGGEWKKKANASDRGRGETPFMLAVRCHRKKIVDYMLKKFKIDFDDVNAEGKTVHGIAIETGRPGMTWLMRKKTNEPKSQLEIDYVVELKAKRAAAAAVAAEAKRGSSSSSSSSSRNKEVRILSRSSTSSYYSPSSSRSINLLKRSHSSSSSSSRN